jgi:flagellar FliL protein
MADATTADKQEKPAPKKGKNLLVLILVLLNVLGLAGAAAYFFLLKGKEGHDEGVAHASEPEHTPTTYGPLVELQPLVVNLANERGGRYARTTISLESVDEESKAMIVAATVPIRNRLIIYFSGMTAEEMQGAERMETMREEILAAVNEVIGAPKVRRVFYSELVVQ